MRVEFKISDDVKEAYAVIYAPALTPQLQELAARLGAGEPVITAMDGERLVILQPGQIYLVRVENDKTYVLCREAEYISNRRLYEMEQLLGPGFLRISKSSIVNLRQIHSVEPSFGGSLLLHLKNGSKDYISRKYLPEFKKYLGI